MRNRSFETHSGWGAAVVLAAAVAGMPIWIAFLIGVVAGIAVEAVQYLFPKTGSPMVEDVIYTGIGAAIGAAWVLLWGPQ
jgi:VanZ family protein